jgi:hypothetical protein
MMRPEQEEGFVHERKPDCVLLAGKSNDRTNLHAPT